MNFENCADIDGFLKLGHIYCLILEMPQKLADSLGILEVAAAGLNLVDGGAETERTTTDVNQYAKGNILRINLNILTSSS